MKTVPVQPDPTLDKYHPLINKVFHDDEFNEFYKVLKISFLPKREIWEATCVVVDENGVPLGSVLTLGGKPIENELVGYGLQDCDGKEDPSVPNMIKDYDNGKHKASQKQKPKKKR